MSEPCGLGPCAANAGHDGSCAEASGWNADDWPRDPLQVVTSSYDEYVRRWRRIHPSSVPYSYRVWARIEAAGTHL